MSTVSIPLSDEMLQGIRRVIDQGEGENVSDVVRKAIRRYLEEEAVNLVLRASGEPSLEGDLENLAKKL